MIRDVEKVLRESELLVIVIPKPQLNSCSWGSEDIPVFLH